METMIIILSVALILYELNRIANCLAIQERVNSSTNNSIESEDTYEKYNALYPVFSEREINHTCKMFSKYHNELGSKWQELIRLEYAEAKKHHESGRDASTFNPPVLLWLLGEINSIANWRNDTEKDLKNKIETNIRALNGMSIEQATKEYYGRQNINQPTIMEDRQIEGLWSFTENPSIGRLKKEFIEDRKESWRERWEYLIKKEADEE